MCLRFHVHLHEEMIKQHKQKIAFYHLVNVAKESFALSITF